MAYSGIELSGIVCPQENVAHFARVYGNENLGMMLAASTIGHPSGQPQFKESNNSEYCPAFRRPAFVDGRNLNTSPQNGLQPSGGSGAEMHGGNANHYHHRHAHHKGRFDLPRAFQCTRSNQNGGHGDHYNSGYSHTHTQQEGFPFPTSFQESRSMRHGGHGDQYYQRMYPQQNQNSLPLPSRYAWL